MFQMVNGKKNSFILHRLIAVVLFIFLIHSPISLAQQPPGDSVSGASDTPAETDIVGSMNFEQQQQYQYPSYQPLNVDEISSNDELQEFEYQYELSRKELDTMKKDGTYLELRKKIIERLDSNKAGAGKQ